MGIGHNRVKPTEKQIKAINGVLSGKNPSQAMTGAGYSRKTTSHTKQNFFHSQGVLQYLAKMDKESLMRFNMNLGDKLVSVYVGGLEATKLHGRNAIEHPDWIARKAFADKLAEFMGWTKEDKTRTFNNQYNFFAVPLEEREDFNIKFGQFVKDYSKIQP